MATCSEVPQPTTPHLGGWLGDLLVEHGSPNLSPWDGLVNLLLLPVCGAGQLGSSERKDVRPQSFRGRRTGGRRRLECCQNLKKAREGEELVEQRGQNEGR